MNPSELNALMHAVLDGEATPSESRELDRILATDPTAKAKYYELQLLFDDLGRIQMAPAPYGIVDAVMERLPRHRTPVSRLRQLFSRTRVSRASATEARSTGRGNTNHRASTTGPYFARGDDMSERKIGILGKRKVWIGTAVAAAAVVLALQYVDWPPGGKDVTGTIVPAQRYRAPQITADDVKVGGQDQTLSTTSNAPAGSSTGSGLDATGRTGLDATGRTGLDATGRTGLDATGRTGLDATGRTGLDATGRTGLDATGRTSLDATGRTGLDATGRNALDATGRNGLDATGRNALDATGRNANNTK